VALPAIVPRLREWRERLKIVDKGSRIVEGNEPPLARSLSLPFAVQSRPTPKSDFNPFPDQSAACQDPAAPGSNRFPLLRDPLRAPESRFVRADETNVEAQPLRHLLDQCGLADLARTRDHLNEPPGLGQAAGENGRLRATVGGSPFTRHGE